MVAIEGKSDNAPATIEAALARCFAALDAAQLHYGHGTDNAWDEAVQLVLGGLGLPADGGEELLPRPLLTGEWNRVSQLTETRIATRKPLPYLLGSAWFAGLRFRCDERALVPRSPLAEVILNDYAPWLRGTAPELILDLCCGGGCIGIAAAHYQPTARVVLADIDAEALGLARENIALHGMAARISTQRSDLFTNLEPASFDVILCNPPYVDARDMAAIPQEFSTEPTHALASGPDGLDHAFRILEQAPSWLSGEGLLFLELGNSWEALEASCPEVSFTWLEFEHGGHGVLVAERDELLANNALFAARAATRWQDRV